MLLTCLQGRWIWAKVQISREITQTELKFYCLYPASEVKLGQSTKICSRWLVYYSLKTKVMAHPDLRDLPTFWNISILEHPVPDCRRPWSIHFSISPRAKVWSRWPNAHFFPLTFGEVHLICLPDALTLLLASWNFCNQLLSFSDFLCEWWWSNVYK